MLAHPAAFIASAAVAALALAVPAQAERPAPYTEIVSYADLDLSSAADVATLDQRIRDAAGRICESAVRAQLVRPIKRFACASEAYSESRRPLVTMLAAIERGEHYAARAPKLVVAAP